MIGLWGLSCGRSGQQRGKAFSRQNSEVVKAVPRDDGRVHNGAIDGSTVLFLQFYGGYTFFWHLRVGDLGSNRM
jgi:hypothetical protein